MTPMIPADCIVRQARLRVSNLVSQAQTVAACLRNNRIGWVAAFEQICDVEKEMYSLCIAFETVLDNIDAPAPQEREQVEALRLATANELQALQAELRETCLFNGPRRSAA